MSVATLILGESGTGKSASLRNLDQDNTLLIQSIRKPLPFRSKGWGYRHKESNPNGNMFVADDASVIAEVMRRTNRKVIIVDDFQYIMANEFMRRTDEKGYDKFTQIGHQAWTLFNVASQLPADVRVYLLSHTDTDDNGRIKLKTIGRMIDEKITAEGMFTIVLRTAIEGGQYYFRTRNNGHDTVKSPMGMFEAEMIPNDLAAVDEAICAYYDLTVTA